MCNLEQEIIGAEAFHHVQIPRWKVTFAVIKMRNLLGTLCRFSTGRWHLPQGHCPWFFAVQLSLVKVSWAPCAAVGWVLCSAVAVPSAAVGWALVGWALC